MSTPTRTHPKVTRQDWIAAALSSLDDVAIDELRILGLAAQLDVSRSSFYWYFTNVEELRTELLGLWERNTESIVERTRRDSATIAEACLGVFECWADHRLYDARLDLAVRDWGHREPTVAALVADADTRRHHALTAMFARHGFAPDDATVRARLVYHSQVGYYAVGTDEPMATRFAYLPYYLEAMTASTPTATELQAFEAVLATIPPRTGG